MLVLPTKMLNSRYWVSCVIVGSQKNAVPADSDSDSNSIQSLREVATTAAAVVTQSSFLLHNIDPNGIVKNAIDARASRLLTYCETYNCNEKAIEGK